MKFTWRDRLHLCSYRTINAQVSKTSSDETASKRNILGGMVELFGSWRDSCEKPKSVVLKNVYSLVVCAKVVHLFLEYGGPKIRANKLHSLQLIFESGHLPGESFYQSISRGISNVFQSRQIFLFFLRFRVWSLRWKVRFKRAFFEFVFTHIIVCI